MVYTIDTARPSALEFMNLWYRPTFLPGLATATCVWMISLTGLAQGTFSCSNLRLQKALITDCTGNPVGGTNYVLELRVMNPANRKWDPGLLHVTATTNRPIERIPVFSGRNSGRFFVGTVLVPFVEPGAEATLQVRAWDRSTGPTFEDSKLRGSSVIKVQLGGVGQPPTMPGTMSQFSGIKLCPSTASEKP